MTTDHNMPVGGKIQLKSATYNTKTLAYPKKEHKVIIIKNVLKRLNVVAFKLLLSVLVITAHVVLPHIYKHDLKH